MNVPRKRRRRKPIPFPLKQLLGLHGWSQNRLVRASGFTMTDVNAWANGRRQPSWSAVMRIMTTIGADLGDLAPSRLDLVVPVRKKQGTIYQLAPAAAQTT
jgi:transcriptional regulator with XRE-family HTH domain